MMTLAETIVGEPTADNGAMLVVPVPSQSAEVAPPISGRVWWTASMADERWRIEDADEVARWSDVYEDALRRNDVAMLDELFWDDPTVVRFGIADWQRGHDAVAGWRATAPAVSPHRVISARHVVALAPGVVAVDLLFIDDVATTGRQSQTWLRTGAGWRIARAHVSVVPAG
jgi:hypothetical protein